MASRGIEPLPVAPYSLDLLADLHAGALPESVSERLWPLVRADARAMEVLAALDAVSCRLGDVGEDTHMGEPMPPDVAERIDRTLASAHRPHASPVTELASTSNPSAQHRSARHLSARHLSARLLGFAAAALVVIAIATVVLVRAATPADPDVVAGPDSPSVLTLESSDIDAGIVYSVMERRDPVQLIDAGRLPDCLEANGIDRAATVLGATDVAIDGRSGTMLILSRHPAAGMTVLAVGAGCGTDQPESLFRRDLS